MINKNIIGHNKIRNYFQRAVKEEKLSHAYLISGENGIGKSLVAKEFAVSILGKEEIRPYVDILEFKNNKSKKSIGVDDIRKIIEEISKKPFEGDKKVIIIYEGDKITPQAQNAFLKTIEEPPKGVYIFILCENTEAILDTIKSRCQVFQLNRLGKDEIIVFITRKYSSLTQNESSAAVSFSDGIPGRAEKFIEDEEFNLMRRTMVTLLSEIGNISESSLLKYGENLSKFKNSNDEMLDTILSFIRDIMIYKDTGDEELIVNRDNKDSIKDASITLSFNKLYNIIKIINDTRLNLKSNTNALLAYEVMLLKMLEA